MKLCFFILNFFCHLSITSCLCEKRYQALPAFTHRKQRKAGWGLGMRLAIVANFTSKLLYICSAQSRDCAISRFAAYSQNPKIEGQSRDCAANLETAQYVCAISELCNTFAQSRDCVNPVHNLEISMQFRDSENAQHNLEIVQIPRLRGTYTLL